ncbi:MAG: GNAT family N-acetyltransferase [Candidatus Thorarchaeota archaeon]|jgi:GNAT superfamily N-acetyltransferase
MVKIRAGTMKDCKDLLTVYQTTRWNHRTVPGGYRTVEQVKEEHRGIGFKKWGWLIAEKKGAVVGEIVFRTEKNSRVGTIGIIRNVDVDVRYQKKGIGTKLTRAAEKAMKIKKAVQVVSTSPPEAYNYWMKIGYFARGSLINISMPISRLTKKTPAKSRVKTLRLSDAKRLPKSMAFSNKAQPGVIVEAVAKVLDKGAKGRLLEFQKDSRVVGIGVIYINENKTASFVSDITKGHDEYFGVVVLGTARLASSLKAKKVISIIPKDQIGEFNSFAKWSHEAARDIPVTKLL